MPFHSTETETIEEDSSSFSISSFAHEHKVLLGTTTAGLAGLAILGATWYYYKYHYVAFGGKPFWPFGEEKDVEEEN